MAANVARDRSQAPVASRKRAKLPRQSLHTKEFRKDWERLSRSGRFNMAALKDVLRLIVDNDAPLPPEYKDHALTGNWREHRECHIGDFLLIYTVDEAKNLVVFVSAGTHAELFE